MKLSYFISRRHGNVGNRPAHAISIDDIKKVVQFIENYAETHAVLLPGRIPGVKDFERVKFLPSSTTKRSVYLQYFKSMESAVERAYKERTFLVYWQKYLPSVKVLKAMSDLCWVCQKNSAAFVKSTNLPLERQSKVNFKT